VQFLRGLLCGRLGFRAERWSGASATRSAGRWAEDRTMLGNLLGEVLGWSRDCLPCVLNAAWPWR